jgi:DNA-binding GntR family transcriptional regulator
MADKKKGLAAMIIASAKPKDMSMEESAEEVSPTRAAAEEVLEAIEAKDAAMLEESMKALIDLCQNESIPELDEEMEEV